LTGLARMRWLEGWHEGRNDWREGLTDALTCYKLSGF
jgi:ribosome modulation factor